MPEVVACAAKDQSVAAVARARNPSDKHGYYYYTRGHNNAL
jgi:hypothetical protein